MLKNFRYKNQEVPVPVPLTLLSDAIAWVESVLLRKDELITKILLNGKALPVEKRGDWSKVKLTNASQLDVQVDSPRDLTIKTLDCVRDLAFELEKKLKLLAVRCWVTPGTADRTELDGAIADTEMLMDLIAHVNGIVDYSQEEMAPINGLAIMIKRVYEKLVAGISGEDWQRCARLLVGRLDPLLKDLVAETETLELRLFSAVGEDRALFASVQLPDGDGIDASAS